MRANELCAQLRATPHPAFGHLLPQGEKEATIKARAGLRETKGASFFAGLQPGQSDMNLMWIQRTPRGSIAGRVIDAETRKKYSPQRHKEHQVELARERAPKTIFVFFVPSWSKRRLRVSASPREKSAFDRSGCLS
jgi:hypothetical protein